VLYLWQGEEIMEVIVCIGSACHLKGSHQVIERLLVLLHENGLENKVKVKAAFCQGKCQEGVAMSIDGQEILGASPKTVDAIFQKYIVGDA
jgi:NADH:ubiquinone oxidoreductase subunit E